MRRLLLLVPALLVQCKPASATPPTFGSAGNGAILSNIFPAGNPWTRDVSAAPVDATSAKVMAGLKEAGGFGHGRFQIDFSMEVLESNASTPLTPWTKTDDWFSPDCDFQPVPVPPGGAVEGESGYACAHDGDCHLIVVDKAANKLYEMWRANMKGGTFTGGCLAVWDTSRVYGANGRGDQCTSADAAGFPITPLLFTADEVAAGSIDHAIRFILPNDRIRAHVFVPPSTHSTRPTGGSAATPPYGAHLRLRADYPVESLPSQGAKVVARALQKYGMFLADGGNIALTAQSDRGTKAKWRGLLRSRDLETITPADFEMLDSGAPHSYTGDCNRNPM